MQKIPIIICIDVEPQERAIDPHARKDWECFARTFEFFRRLRPQLESATGASVHFSWFFRLDPQIQHTYGSASWVVTRYRHLIEELKLAGDELGLHTHPWRWDDLAQTWIADFGNQEWIDYCVRLGFEAFRQSLDQPCLSFRFGDHWINDATLQLVEKLGARFDLTLEPGQTRTQLHETFTGSLPDHSHIPRQPYRPSEANYQQQDFGQKRPLWMIPLSTGSTDWVFTSPDSERVSATSPQASQQTLSRRSGGSDTALSVPQSHYEGYHDIADSQMIAGWVYDISHPERTVEVEVYAGDKLLTTVPANSFRPDLLSAGKGNGKHSFSLPVPSWLKDGRAYSIRVKVAGTDFDLSHTPRELKSCQEDFAQGAYMTLDLSSNSLVVCRIINTLLNLLKRPYLALVVRTHVALDPQQQSHLEQSFDFILSHPLARQFVIETPAGMIDRMK